MIPKKEDKPLPFEKHKPPKETLVDGDIHLAKVNYQNALSKYRYALTVLSAAKKELKRIEEGRKNERM